MDQVTSQRTEISRVIDAAAERIRLRLRHSTEDIIAIGKDLLMVKEQLEHGRFEAWIKAEFAMTLRTAERFMSVAERFGKDDIVSDLSASALYLLAAPSTPEPVIDEVKERAASGEKVTVADIKRLKADAQTLRAENAALRDDNAALADNVAELRSKVVEIPIPLMAISDRRASEGQYRAFVMHWRSLPMDLRERFFEEHKTPFATRLPLETEGKTAQHDR
jgi:hypothetical protein